ncbi:MAG: DUF386 domain-containing protein [Sphingobacteriales bacterium]|nr:MAG: DUF386 domain-containing protein [Sphingobacteriales bacterium]
MILDKIENIALYKNLMPRINGVIDFIEKNNLSTLESGKYEVEGDDLFVLIQEYDTKEISEGKMEAHRMYIDIQYMLEGVENIGYETLRNQTPIMEYSMERDVMFFANKSEIMLKLDAGIFAVFYPADIHMPSLKVNEISKVKKAVFKIKIE